ncbi:MAG TPA: hypothetical protein VGK67_08510 [Myxococcales bacterium]
MPATSNAPAARKIQLRLLLGRRPPGLAGAAGLASDADLDLLVTGSASSAEGPGILALAVALLALTLPRRRSRPSAQG